MTPNKNLDLSSVTLGIAISKDICSICVTVDVFLFLSYNELKSYPAKKRNERAKT